MKGSKGSIRFGAPFPLNATGGQSSGVRVSSSLNQATKAYTSCVANNTTQQSQSGPRAHHILSTKAAKLIIINIWLPTEWIFDFVLSSPKHQHWPSLVPKGHQGSNHLLCDPLRCLLLSVSQILEATYSLPPQGIQLFGQATFPCVEKIFIDLKISLALLCWDLSLPTVPGLKYPHIFWGKMPGERSVHNEMMYKMFKSSCKHCIVAGMLPPG